MRLVLQNIITRDWFKLSHISFPNSVQAHLYDDEDKFLGMGIFRLGSSKRTIMECCVSGKKDYVLPETEPTIEYLPNRYRGSLIPNFYHPKFEKETNYLK